MFLLYGFEGNHTFARYSSSTCCEPHNDGKYCAQQCPQSVMHSSPSRVSFSPPSFATFGNLMYYFLRTLYCCSWRQGAKSTLRFCFFRDSSTDHSYSQEYTLHTYYCIAVRHRWSQYTPFVLRVLRVLRHWRPKYCECWENEQY